MPEEQKQYRGRIVSRGDDVRDAEGYLAVFSEQGTSASHLEAAKTMDALARLSVDTDDLPDSGDARASHFYGDDIVSMGSAMAKMLMPLVPIRKFFWEDPRLGLLFRASIGHQRGTASTPNQSVF